MVENFKTTAEMRKFCEAQHRTIVDLSRKLREVERKLEDKPPSIALNTALDGITDQEVICRTQLAIMKEKALQGELTLEEAKKVDIYTKVLNLNNNSEEESPTFKAMKELTSEELVALVEQPEQESS
jgi:hypothetical protein